MDVTHHGGRQSTGSPLAWAGALLAYAVFCFRLPDTDVSGAEAAGYIVGTYVVTLLLALAVWSIVHLATRRRKGLPFASPWIFAIAAALGLLSLLGNLSSGS